MSRPALCFYILTLFFATLSFSLVAQNTGGRSKLDFLQLPATGTSTAMGANHITVSGNDPALFFQNPAALDSTVSDNIALNLMSYLADTKMVNLAYAKSLKNNRGTWVAGIQYLHYGTMEQTDDIGNVIGEFRAADYGLSLGYAHKIGAFTVGATSKLVASAMESYTTWGIAMDWGATFKHPQQDLTIGLTVKNIGFLKQNFYSGYDPILPFDVRIGVSTKPLYMPIRFTATVHHLNKFDMVYNDPNLFYTYTNTGLRQPREVGVVEKLARHLSLGTEILIHTNFRILLGYDHLRRQELRLVNRGALAGFSYGAWFRVKNFEITYGRSQYTPGFASNSFSIVMNLKNGFVKDKTYAKGKFIQ